MTELEIRLRAVELTIGYFQGKNPTQDAFMEHLEKTFKFLFDGTINNGPMLSKEEQDIIKTFKK